MYNLVERKVGAPRQTKQNHYFVASEHGPEAAKGGEGAAQRFSLGHTLARFIWAK
jgi:hypothetical protein